LSSSGDWPSQTYINTTHHTLSRGCPAVETDPHRPTSTTHTTLSLSRLSSSGDWPSQTYIDNTHHTLSRGCPAVETDPHRPTSTPPLPHCHTDAIDQWCLWKLLGIKWYHHVQNEEVRRTIGQSHLSAIVQARRLSLFSHIARMPGETDAKKILTASLLDNWRRPPGRPHTTWMKTIQQDLKSNNLSRNEAIDVAQNRPLWRLMSVFGDTHS